MTNKKTTETRQFVGNGQQTTAMDGMQVGVGGLKMTMEGIQKGLVTQPVPGMQQREYGRQLTPPPAVPAQRTFAPASGPKIPPMKK